MATGAIVARILTQYSAKGSKEARKDIQKLGKQFDHFSKMAVKSFALVGAASFAMATKIGKDSVQAAIEDQKSQALLAKQLEATSGATKGAIAQVEDYITKQQLLVGVADDELRPSLATLARATGDVTEAQRLQGLALDISAGTGKDLQTVSLALAKAYGGNLGALTRLGVPLDANIVKTKDFSKAVDVLSKSFEGQANTAAGTFAGRMSILQIRVKEIQETLGYALLPVLQKFADYIGTNVLPQIEAWVNLNKDKLAKGLQTTINLLVTVTKKAFAFGDWLTRNKPIVVFVAGVMATMWAVGKVAAFVTAIEGLTAAFAALRTTAIGAAIAEAFATAGISVGMAATAIAAAGAVWGLMNMGDEAAKTADAIATIAAPQMQGKITASLTQTFGMLGKIHAVKVATTKTTATTVKLTKEQLATQKAIAALTKLGSTPSSETDPIQLEAARQNLVKQAIIQHKNEADAINAKFTALISAAQAAQRYKDAMGAIADGVLSNAEIINLSVAWGVSQSEVVKYVDSLKKPFVLDPSFVDSVTNIGKGWDTNLDKVKAYIAAVAGITIPNSPGSGGGGTDPGDSSKDRRPPKPYSPTASYGSETSSIDPTVGGRLGGNNSVVGGLTVNINGGLIDTGGFKSAVQDAYQELVRFGSPVGTNSR